MTGFGKAIVNAENRIIHIEIRTLNSKQLDINSRLPLIYREKETDIRTEIGRELERGKIDLIVTIENDQDISGASVNKPLAQRYYNEIVQLAADLGENVSSSVLSDILRMPDVLKNDREIMAEEEWIVLKSGVSEAIAKVNEFRKQEGDLIGKDMNSHLQLILGLLEQVEPFEKSRITNLRDRFNRNQDEFLETPGKMDKFDENRFEQEIFWYLEKLDISEEKQRLRKHCEYFTETLKSNDSNGRKLGFITQEVGREINTLGSKAYDVEIQKIVVQMKDELEKIKEQLGNVL